VTETETETPILLDIAGPVARITINRPRYRNAQNGALLYALDDAFREATDTEAVRAVILRAAGDHFSSGHDIGSPGRDFDHSRDDRRLLWWDHVGKPGAEAAYVREQELYLGFCRRWRAMPKPTVAAVQGGCIAGGLMLAWVCDLIVASEDAFFSDPVLRMGVPGVEYFAHAFEMHPRIAREFLFLGERMDAQRAYQLGMINRVVPRDALDAEAQSIAERLAAMPAFGMTLAKQAFNVVDDIQGRRSAMDATYHIHHLAHAHNALTSGDRNGGLDAKSMAALTRDDNSK
jgi:enoyl-CoA hydratase